MIAQKMRHVRGNDGLSQGGAGFRMPIFYKNKERVLFVHIPKTAGISMAVWFCKNYWYMKNFRLHAGRSKDIFVREFGIDFVPLEGPQSVTTTPQHAIAKTYLQWGTFTTGFSIVRNPLTRFFSHVRYAYDAWLDQERRVHTPETLKRFSRSYTTQILGSVRDNPEFADNHIRPQADFLTKKLVILRYEGDWETFLADKYRLHTPLPGYNKTPMDVTKEIIMPKDHFEALIEYYQVDYELLGYKIPRLPETSGSTDIHQRETEEE